MSDTRTYDDLYADLIAASDVTLQPGYDHAAYAARLADIWDEIARTADRDDHLPAFARLAAVLVRDRYRNEAANQ